MNEQNKQTQNLNRRKRTCKRRSGAPYGNKNAVGNKGGGAPIGNKNAVGHGAPLGNLNAEKHGLYTGGGYAAGREIRKLLRVLKAKNLES